MSDHNYKKSSAAEALRGTRLYRMDVQGLRAIAVAAVLLYHSNSGWLKAGYIGVDIFFVISGYIITSLLVGQSGCIDLANFYIGRVKRIVPAYFVMLGLVTVVAAVLFIPADFAFFLASLKSSALYNSNQYFAGFGSYFAPKADELPLLHTWSLAIEMQFYLFFPVLVLCVPVRWRLLVFALLAIILFGWSDYRALTATHDELYFALSARVPEFMVGAMIAVLMRERGLHYRFEALLGGLGAALLAWAVVAIDKDEYPGLWSILPCIGAALVIIARRGPVSVLLSTAPMVWLGGISYSLYLWHWPVLAFMRYYTGQYELTGSWLLMFMASSLVLAWLSYRFVETPVRTARGSLRHLAKWTAAGLVFVTVVWGGKQVNALLVASLPVEFTRYAAPELICHGTQVGDCKRGKPDADVSVLVIGDSHAAQLNYFFDRVGEEEGVAYRVLSSSSCVPISGFDVERLPGWAQKPCRSQIKAVAREMSKVDRLIVAGMWQYHMKSQAFVKAFSDFLTINASAHKRIVVLAQVPMFETDVRRIRRFTEIGLPAPLIFNSEWQAANEQMRVIVEHTPGARFLDFSRSRFFTTAPYHQGSLIYRDTHHLNELGASRYGHYAAEQLQRIFDQPQSNVSLKP